MWQSQGPWPGSKCSKTVEVGCSYSELKPCQGEIAIDEIQERKIIESEAICYAKWLLCCRRIQHHAGIEPMSPDYQ